MSEPLVVKIYLWGVSTKGALMLGICGNENNMCKIQWSDFSVNPNEEIPFVILRKYEILSKKFIVELSLFNLVIIVLLHSALFVVLLHVQSFSILANADKCTFIQNATVQRYIQNEEISNAETFAHQSIRSIEAAKFMHQSLCDLFVNILLTRSNSAYITSGNSSIGMIGILKDWKQQSTVSGVVGMGIIVNHCDEREYNIFGRSNSMRFSLQASTDTFIFENLIYQARNGLFAINEANIWTCFHEDILARIVPMLNAPVPEPNDDLTDDNLSNDSNDESGETIIDFDLIPGIFVNNTLNTVLYDLYKNNQMIRDMLNYAHKTNGETLPYVDYLQRESIQKLTNAEVRDLAILNKWFQESGKNDNNLQPIIDTRCCTLIPNKHSIAQCVCELFTICDCLHIDDNDNGTHGQCGNHNDGSFDKDCKYGVILCNETECQMAAIALCTKNHTVVHARHGKCLQHQTSECTWL